MSAVTQQLALKEVAVINPPLDRGLSVNDKVSFVPMAAVDADASSVQRFTERAYGDVGKGYTPFRSGDVLVAKITPCFENGKIAQAVLTTNYGFGSTEFHVVRPRDERVDGRYLLHFLRRREIRDAGERRMTGSAGQRRVPESFLSDLRMPVPSLLQQRRIVAILDQTEALRVHQAQALTLLDDIRAALFRKAFVEQSDSAPVVPLRTIVEEFRYGTSEKSGPKGFPALRIPNIVDGGMNVTELKTVDVLESEFKRLRLHSGDLLFVRTNGNPEYVGRSAVFDPAAFLALGSQGDNVIFASYLIRARLKRDTVLPVVLQQYLSSQEGRASLRKRCKTSAGQYNINTEGLGAIPVPVWPLELQLRFARQVGGLDTLVAQHRASKRSMDALFASLQHRAFSGQL